MFLSCVAPTKGSSGALKRRYFKSVRQFSMLPLFQKHSRNDTNDLLSGPTDFFESNKNPKIVKIKPDKRCKIHEKKLNVFYKNCNCMKKIKVRKNNYHDIKGKQALENEDELLKYIVKIYKTMMYRGIKGTYIYVCDIDLREYFEKHIMLYKQKD